PARGVLDVGHLSLPRLTDSAAVIVAAKSGPFHRPISSHGHVRGVLAPGALAGRGAASRRVGSVEAQSHPGRRHTRGVIAARRMSLKTLAARHQPAHDVRTRSRVVQSAARATDAARQPRMSPLAPSTAAPARGSDYAQLSRQVKEAGLLVPRPGCYVWKIAVTAALLAAGWAAFVLVGDSWWQIAVAIFLAAVFTQIGFLGHDAGHRQIFRSRRASYILGILLGDLGIGLSYGWW